MLDHNEGVQPSLKGRLGLSEDPFSARVNAFYDGAQRRHNLETLRHLSIFGDMVLLLTGDRGSGKTALIDQFSKNFANEIQLIRLSAGSGSERINSIVRLAAISGLEISAKDPARDVLEHLIDKYAENFEKTGKRTLVIVDDAHALPADELLTYLQVMGSLDPESGAVLSLVGLPSLMHEVTSYEHPDRSDWLHQIHLKPLNEQETEEYLVCRLEAAGYVGELPLDRAQIAQLHDLARGMPGMVGESFSAILLGMAGPSSENLPSVSRVPQYALYAISVLLVLSFVFVSYQHGFFDSGEPQAEVLVASAAEDSLEKARRLALLEKAIAESAEMASESLSPISGDDDALYLDVTDASVANDSVLDSAANLDEVAGISEVISEAVVTQGSRRELIVVAQDTGESGSLDVPLRGESKLSQAIGEDSSVRVTPLVKGEDSEPLVKPAIARKIEVKKERSSLSSKVIAEHEASYRSKAWVLSQADTAYTAQVLGSYNEETARKFVQRQKAAAPELYYVLTEYKGRAWYVVLFGTFESKRLAEQALKASSRGVKSQKPWLRSFAGIKASFTN